jgi:hypothetical protein
MNTDPHLPPSPMHQDDEQERSFNRRAEDHLGTFRQLIDQHTADEMERHDAIIERLDQNDSKLAHIEAGQAAMNLSIQAFMTENGQFFKAIQRAFPKDDEGNPDYDGHKKAHLSWISNAKDEREVMEFVRKQMKDEQKSEDIVTYTKKVIFAGAALAVVSFIAIATWAAFLKGPM